jgi:hypothetical protein
VITLQALHSALSSDLDDLERRIRALARHGQGDSDKLSQEMAALCEARTGLHSGLASIAEVLAWIEWKTEEDPEGEVATVLQNMPALRGCVIH